MPGVHKLSIRTPEIRRKFLRVLRKTMSATHACKATGISWNGAYTWRRNDPVFRKAWAKAIREGRKRRIPELEAAFIDRAINGWLEPVFYLGEIIGHVRKFCSTRELFALKANMKRYHLEKKQIEALPMGTGVLVAPAEKTPEEWIADQTSSHAARAALRQAKLAAKANKNGNGNGNKGTGTVDRA